MIKGTMQWGAVLTALTMAATAIAFMVRLQANEEHLQADIVRLHSKVEHLQTDAANQIASHAALESRLTAIETKIEKGTLAEPPPLENPCQSAKISSLPTAANQGVPANTYLSWTPAHCKMVVQGYRNEALMNEFQKVPQASGAVTLGEAVTSSKGVMNLGMTELKILVPGSRLAAQEGVWVNVTP